MPADHDPEPPPTNPGFLLSRVGTAVQSNFKGILARWNLRPLHFLVLTALNREGGVSQQQLCNQLSIDSGNMVQLLDHLEGQRLARREPDAADRRRHIVTITTAGRERLIEIGGSVEEMHLDFFAPLDASEQRRLVAMLGKLYRNTPEGQRRVAPIGTPGAPEGSR